ncbi:MAG: hypothetical protein R3D05_08820 [Dongiaceae bacterium]
MTELGRQVLGGGHHISVEAQDATPQMSAVFPASCGHGRKMATATCWRRILIWRPAVAAKVAEAGGELLSLGIRQASLESVYARYFEEASHAA